MYDFKSEHLLLYDLKLKLFLVFLILIVLLLVITILGYRIRKFLNVERKKWFSYNHINERHKKLDWSIRIIFVIFLFINYLYTISNIEAGNPRNIEVWFILTIFITVSELLRAFMEWKYAENRKAFIATIAELFLALGILILTISTDFFGIF